MKLLIILLTALLPRFANAQDCNQNQYGCSDFPKPQTKQKIFLSCSGITYDGQHAIHLTVRQLGPNEFRAIAQATNGERISTKLRHGYGMLIPEGGPTNDNRLAVLLRNGGVKNKVLLRWDAQITGMQYGHQPMTCAEDQD